MSETLKGKSVLRQILQESTGPKTAQGKVAVSKNAVKHGPFAHKATVSGDGVLKKRTVRQGKLVQSSRF